MHLMHIFCGKNSSELPFFLNQKDLFINVSVSWVTIVT